MRTGRASGGRTMLCPSRRAMTLVELVVSLAIIAVLVGLLLPAVQRVRDAGCRVACGNNLRQIGLALHGFHDARRSLPVGTERQFQPFLAWSARILPYLEQSALWDQTLQAFRQDPRLIANPPHVGLNTALSVYVCPADGRTNDVVMPEGYRVAFTHYPGVSGAELVYGQGMFYLNSDVRLADVIDGTSSTVMVGERPPGPDETETLRFGWWYGGVGQANDGSADFVLGTASETGRSAIPPVQKVLTTLVRGARITRVTSFTSGVAITAAAISCSPTGPFGSCPTPPTQSFPN
jgi:prepilin-type N-terminal cleavage/methylation domain-containing protein